MSIKLQIRRGTAANWTGANPTLLPGEIGFETDTGNLKVGDGTNVWSDLAYQFPYLTGARNHAPEDITTLVIDQTNDRVGIGTNTPQAKVHIEDASPVIRLKDTGAAAYSVIDADNTTGSLTLGADAGNGVASSTLNLAVDGSTKVTVDGNGSVGIGTTSPAQQVHIESAAPVIRLRDTTGGNTAYSDITANTDAAGGIVISADPGSTSASASYVRLAVDGTTRVEATTTGATITGPLTPTNGITANTVDPSALLNATGPTFIGRLTATSGAMSALSQADARSALAMFAPLSAIGLVSGSGSSIPGDWCNINNDTSFTIPTGGTWFVFFVLRNTSTNVVGSNSQAGLFAGGSTFTNAGFRHHGFCWRVY